MGMPGLNAHIDADDRRVLSSRISYGKLWKAFLNSVGLRILPGQPCTNEGHPICHSGPY